MAQNNGKNAKYFSATYKEAKLKFRAAVKALGDIARLDTIDLGITGSKGEPLEIDLCQIGAKEPETVFIHSSGVHGPEGFAGSAIQCQFLDEISSRALNLDSTTSILLVHIVNPYGMSWRRRWNENGVDLNRNCLTEEEFKKEKTVTNEMYTAIHDTINPPVEMTFWTASYYLALAYNVAVHGYSTIAKAIPRGQREYPNGAFYGGVTLQPSHKLLIEWLKKNITSTAKHIVHIDVHTGYGKYMEDILIRNGDRSRFTPEFTKLMGEELVDFASSGGYETPGDVIDGLGAMAYPGDDVKVNAFTQEFGTYSGVQVVKALREENYYHVHKKVDVDHWSKVQVEQAFYMSKDEAWKSNVLNRGDEIIKKCMKYLNIVQE